MRAAGVGFPLNPVRLTFHFSVPSRSGWVPERSVNSDDLRKLEQYICLQKEAIRVLSLENRKAMELISKEAKEKQQTQSEKKSPFETMKLKGPKEDSQKSKTTGSTDQTRPFRIIKDLKNQLEEKDKLLATMRSKYVDRHVESS